MKSNNFLHLHKLTEIQIRLIFGLIVIVLINIIIYNSLSAGEPSGINLLNRLGTYVYVLCILFMCIFSFFKKQKLLEYTFYLLLGLLAANIVFNLIDLIINKRISDNGPAILVDAFLIWISSLGVFGFWYWIIDRGGPISRELENKNTRYDLLFPQYQGSIPGWEHWKPNFWDYFVFSFFTSTGFSPADTLPLTLRTKLLMVVEASISLIIIGMVASRAISLIQ